MAGGVLAVPAAYGWWQRNELTRLALTTRENEAVELSAAAVRDPETCVLTPEQVEGPFFFKAPVRRDIREDRKGLPLSLQLDVVRADGCTPVPKALVEIWHCDAEGRYSGYPENLSRRPLDTMLFIGRSGEHVDAVNAKTYLRGAQVTDAQGHVAFDTIFPGWYEPRVTHIHVKVFLEDVSYLTTQLYFRDEFVNEIYGRHGAYVPHGRAPYRHTNDVVLSAHPDGNGLLLAPEEDQRGLTATGRLALA